MDHSDRAVKQGLRNAAGHQLKTAACSGDGVPFRLVCWAAHGLGLHLGGMVPSITQVRRLMAMGPSLRCISSSSVWSSLVAISSHEGDGEGNTLLSHRLYLWGLSRTGIFRKENRCKFPSQFLGGYQESQFGLLDHQAIR
jgi:hypothetical protein